MANERQPTIKPALPPRRELLVFVSGDRQPRYFATLTAAGKFLVETGLIDPGII